MPNIEEVISVTDLYYQELSSTNEMRQAFQDILVSQSGYLFQAFKNDKVLTDRYKQALKLKTVDSNALLRGLFIQSVSIYEDFIRKLVSYVVTKITNSGESYRDLNLKLQNHFISTSGKVLSYYGSGTVNGVKYDFNNLTDSLVSCLSHQKDYYIDPRVFTILLGNCNSTRLSKLFDILNVSNDIFEDINLDPHLRIYLKETRKSQVIELCKNELDNFINMRNDIAHGYLTRSVSVDELKNSIEFFQTFIKAISRVC